jgi:lysyl-tRNA synthetase class 2
MEPQAPTESELLQVRRDKLEALKAKGIAPFGGKFETTHEPGALKENFTEALPVKVGGRVLAKRTMGKAIFFDIGDYTGRIQVYANKKEVGDEPFDMLGGLVDIGDWVGVEGETFVTRMGEKSILAKGLTFLSKGLRPLPDKWHGITDREQIYRQRYLDLISNDASRSIFVTRSKMIAEIRRYLQDRGFMEVETPMMQDVAGGAAARPFETYHNALDMPLYLRIAPELFLKRLLVGGFTKIFELNRNFRNEGISRRHNPEFTMLEAYWAFADFRQMADLVEGMVCHLAETYCGGLKLEHKNAEGEVTKTINLARPWRRESYKNLLKGVDPQWWDYTPEQRKARAAELGVEIGANFEDYEVTQHVFERLVEAVQMDPLYVTHCPKQLVPLAKQNDEDESVVDVYELVINGQEISPGYSELNDPIVQRARLEEQAGEEIQKIDEDFITALEYGMPPAGGIGIGIDRLIMMLTGAESIRDVVFFPQLKRKD